MPAPYSDDLRSKAIAAVKRGERKTDVSRWFNISRNTLDLWLKREAKEGHCHPIDCHRQSSKQKIKDWQRFGAFIQQHGGKTQAQLAKLWGDNVTQQNISDALQKLGVSRKKRHPGIKSASKQKRQAKEQQLKTKSALQIIYVDEAGIDNREDYAYGYCDIGQRFYGS